MIKKLAVGDEIYAILVTADQIKSGTEWFGSQFESLQASRMVYDKGKEFRLHYHILNPRTIKRTQEAFVVISGELEVTVYDSKSVLGVLHAKAGELIILYRGGHSVVVKEDCVVYEIKAGSYTYVSEDKEFPAG